MLHRKFGKTTWHSYGNELFTLQFMQELFKTFEYLGSGSLSLSRLPHVMTAGQRCTSHTTVSCSLYEIQTLYYKQTFETE